MDAVSEAEDKPDILKLGCVPPGQGPAVRFMRAHRECVLEELDDFLEQALKAAAFEAGWTPLCWEGSPED
jgi:TPP-dependent indolepyruvate ferredoxin oxidoreductase alpha subunit